MGIEEQTELKGYSLIHGTEPFQIRISQSRNESFIS